VDAIFIARQHAMHAKRDIIFTNSVCPSNAGTVSKRMNMIVTLFLTIW